MKNRFKKISVVIITSIVLVFTACNPSTEEIRTYLSEEKYENVQSYLETAINDNKHELVLSKKEESTTFEVALLGLLFSNSDHSDYASEVLSKIRNNLSYERQAFDLGQKIWHRVLNSSKPIPEGVHHLLLESYDYNNPDEDKLKHIRNDSLFNPWIRAELSETIQNNIFDSGKMKWLADVGELSEIKNTLDDIASLQQQKRNVSREQKTLSDKDSKNRLSNYSVSPSEQHQKVQKNVQELRTKIYRLNNRFENDEFLAQEISFIFEGYMVSYRENSVFGGEIYETKDMVGNIVVLVTKETVYSTKGFFSLRVVKVTDLPMRLKEEYGGFATSVPVYLEITSDEWTEYLTAKEEIKELPRQLERAEKQLSSPVKSNPKSTYTPDPKLTQLNNEIENYDNQIKTLRNSLVAWAKQNSLP